MDWLTAIDRYGLPIIGLLAFALLFWRLIQWAKTQFDWTKKHVVEPVVAGHIKFLESSTKNQELQTKAMERLSTSCQRNGEMVERNEEVLRQLACMKERP